ncbi:NAD-dependent epimerase/dehydratase family protein [Streptosporangium sp. KLBMP 9127]|nr:NAD(P)-dependent oxidoreductase [Streptosporangium sp. KLBMP 9127]
MTTVLITGAAGKVGTMLRPGLDGLDLRIADTRAAPDWGDAEALVGDVADPAFAAAALDGVDAVVHLAAHPVPSASWAELRRPNIDGIVTVLDAARDAGVPKVVLAGSVHTMGGYVRPGETVVDPAWPVRPCCRYGATKAFAEAYGGMIAAVSDTSVICLRLGACLPRPTTTGNLAEWLGPADLGGLVRAALTADVRTGAYFGVSANTRRAFDLTNAAHDLGYVPRLDSEAYASDLPSGRGGVCALTHYSEVPVVDV